jgi:hypothetical protein
VEPFYTEVELPYIVPLNYLGLKFSLCSSDIFKDVISKHIEADWKKFLLAIFGENVSIKKVCIMSLKESMSAY